MLVLGHIFGDESPECLQEYIFLWKVLHWLKKIIITSEAIFNVWKEWQTRAGLVAHRGAPAWWASAGGEERKPFSVWFLAQALAGLWGNGSYITSTLKGRKKHGLWLVQRDITCHVSWWRERWNNPASLVIKPGARLLSSLVLCQR